MQKLPRDMFRRYHAELDGSGVPERAKPHYAKWVRYFRQRPVSC